MNNELKPEVFAAVCAVESREETTECASWTTGHGSGSDQDD